MSEDQEAYLTKLPPRSMILADGSPEIGLSGTAATASQRLPSSLLRDVKRDANMDTPNYYAVIPAEVRYDNRLSPNQKLLYGEITALSTKTGSCWAGNRYFSELYGVSKETVSRWVSGLIKHGYIESKMYRKENSNEIDIRVLTLSSRPPCEKDQDPHDEKLKVNNTRVNNTRRGAVKKRAAQKKQTPKPSPEETLSSAKRKSLETWLAYKKEKGQSYKPLGLAALIKKWSGFTDQQVASAVDVAMSNGWAGCFPERETGASKSGAERHVSSSQNEEDYTL